MKKWKRCKVCGANDVPISARGLCWKCGRARMEKATWQLKTKEGTYWESWKRGMKRFAKDLKVD